jgi:hypothetical protein
MYRRRFASRLVLVVVVAIAGLAVPPATAACSCAMPGPMADYRGAPDTAVFTGFIDPRDGRGYPVTITRWFQGGGIIEPRVWFTVESFSGDGASCGVAPLPIGTEWIFVAYRIEGMYGTGLCSPHAAIASADGQAMLADAVRTFGGGGTVATDPPSDPDPPASPARALTDIVGPFVLVLLAGLAFLVGVVGVLRRMRVERD